MIRARTLGLALLIVHTCAANGRAQTTISGRVLDAGGEPVPGIEVLLHAITESSGREVDRDTSRTDGGFELVVKSVDEGSVYFVAVTHDGQLYIGDLLRAPFPLEQEYVVRVGVNPIDLSGAAAGNAVAPPPPDPQNRAAGVVVIVVAGALIGSLLIVAMRRRPPARRRVLVELARLEEELAANAGGDATLEQRRRALRERLRAGKSG